MIRPSSLPMLAKCPQFAGKPNDYTEAGSRRHAALTTLLSLEEPAAILDQVEIDQVEIDALAWAVDFIRTKAPMVHYPLELEQAGQFVTENFEVITGTPDVTCGPVVFDLKWRERDYLPQMACYAMMLIQRGHKTVTVHLLFGAFRKVQTVEFDETSAMNIIAPILARAGTGEPTPCEYCSWCAKLTECPAAQATAKAVANGYADRLGAVENWHPSKMESAGDIAFALHVWRSILKPWGESIEFHAKEAALKKGMTLPGFELSERKGKTFCTDVAAAFSLAGVSQEDFLRACDLRLNSSTKTGRVGLIDLYIAAQKAPNKAKAKRDLLARLEPTLQTLPSTVTLRAVSGETEQEQD